MVFSKDRHEPLSGQGWNPELVNRVVATEFEATQQFLMAKGWQSAELASSPATTMYEGALGALWVLDYIGLVLDLESAFSIPELAQEIYADFDRFEGEAFKDLDVENSAASYFLGGSGALNILQKLDPERYSDYQAKLIEIAAGNIANPALEALWGGPGSILPILNNLERSPNDARLADLFVEQFDYLRSQLIHSEEYDCPIWVQDLYGEKRCLTGAGHGFVGNVYPFLRGQAYLSAERREWLFKTTIETLMKTATVEGDLANWQSSLVESLRNPSKFLVQWCHGAPGVVMAVNDIPLGYSQQLDDLLLKAGETIWRAGPLAKDLGLCHGTDGNAFALLKLYERTGDELWLQRARAFAMHAVAQLAAIRDSQSGGGFGVWEGNSALPMLLLACQAGRAHIPLYDFV